ncbi:MAG: hypothetical protein JOY69_09930 [Candidatus Eremiobacteraeota bacterium]|nr:hypothetical protein [Candidatus Eremiobacteraeota bacterium]
MSSNESKTGSPFQFVLIDPIVVNGNVVAAQGAIGNGTLLLAGPAGNKGHEGDLTLRIDSVPTVDGGKVLFDDQHFEINGTNAKLASAAAGFIPFVGFFAQFIRGQEEHLSARNEIETVLLRPATIAAAPPTCTSPSPSALATAAASPMPGASPTPEASPTPCTPPIPTCSVASASPSPSPLPTAPPSVAPDVTPAAPEVASAPTQPPCIPPTPVPQMTPYGYRYPSASPLPATPANSTPPTAAPSPAPSGV